MMIKKGIFYYISYRFTHNVTSLASGPYLAVPVTDTFALVIHKDNTLAWVNTFLKSELPLLMFLDEKAAKKFIKSGNCPSIPAGVTYRITKSRVERIGEPVSKIPGAFKALNRRNFSSNTNLDDLKQLDLTALSNNVHSKVTANCRAINIASIKTKCPITKLSDSILCVIDDFVKTLSLDYISTTVSYTMINRSYKDVLKKSSISYLYPAQKPLLITDKSGTKIIAVKYFPSYLNLNITAPIEFPQRSMLATADTYGKYTDLFHYIVFNEPNMSRKWLVLQLFIDNVLPENVKDGIEFNLSAPISLECDSLNYLECMSKAAAAIAKEIKTNLLSQDLASKFSQNIDKDVAKVLVELFEYSLKKDA